MTQPFLSIIVPVHNGASTLASCLGAIVAFRDPAWELIVIDDASTDASGWIAQKLGARVIKAPSQQGPAAARNLGAQIAQGDYLCFIDADCEVNSTTFSQLVRLLLEEPEWDAVFGSYDDAPKATNFVAQYKNLFHHYVHQTAKEEASTFWAGCGAVQRSTFLRLGGFDVDRFPRPSVEDIDLGYRLRLAGYRIHLAKEVQVKHHKAWSFWGLLRTDVCDRGIPWTQLLLQYRSGLINDLNLKLSHRLSVVLVYLLLLFCFLSLYQPMAILLIVLAVAGLLILNAEVYRFFYRKRRFNFMLVAVLMHWFYYFYSGLSFVLGAGLYWRTRFKPKQQLKKLFHLSFNNSTL
ncbi:glycosyltransferase [Leptolyngbya sp. FACHB-17]|uniref:glycosyltransferase n=1 Tax=unclassified Leptolyngbya TaxID=2650499 RepID=UPI003220A133